MPCFFDIVISQRVPDSGPNGGQSPVEWEKIPSIHPSIPLNSPQTSLAGPQTPPTGPQTPPTGLQTPYMKDGQMDGQQTEFLPILQDLVPCWGRCSKTYATG